MTDADISNLQLNCKGHHFIIQVDTSKPIGPQMVLCPICRKESHRVMHPLIAASEQGMLHLKGNPVMTSDHLRCLPCKGGDCHKPIPIAYSNLLEIPSGGRLSPEDAGHEIFACPFCGHVSDYTPLDIRHPSEFHRAVPYPETLRDLGIVEFECETNRCSTRVLVLLPTDAAANADSIWRAAQKWRFVNATCKKNRHPVRSLPERENCMISFAARRATSQC